MSGRWFGRRGRIALLVGLLAAWALVLYATRTPQPSAPRGGAHAAPTPASVPASSAASVPAH